MSYRISIFLVAAFFSVPSLGQSKHPCASAIPLRGQVESQTGTVEFKLKGETKKYILADLLLLNGEQGLLPIGDRSNSTASTMAKAANGDITLYRAQPSSDRYGRVPVHVWKGDLWLQGQLLSSGHALTFALGQTSQCRQAMMAKEQEAMQKNLGVWKQESLEIPSNHLEKLADKAGHFVLVKGKVLSIGNRKNHIYLNFGQKWTQDFTVSVAKKGTSAFRGDVRTLLNLKDKTIRVRGMLEEQQGPLIRVIDEAQIEIID